MKKLITAITLIATASFVNAESLETNGFSYDYVQGSYQYLKYKDTVDGTSISTNASAYVAEVSKALNENVFMNASYAYIKSTSMTIDGTSYAVGLTGNGGLVNIGYRFPVGKETDFNIQVGYRSLQRKATYSGTTLISETNSTYPITAQIRQKITPSAELEAGYTREDGDNNWYIGIGFEVTKSLNIIGALAPSSTGDVYMLGVRYNY
jgi:hypothetical protein